MEKFRRDVGGIFWAALALFLALALASFHPADPSFNSTASFHKHVLNLCGYFGSFLSDFLYQAIGVSAWVFVVGAVRLSLRSFKGQASKFLPSRLVWLTLFILVLSSIGSLYFPETKMFKGQIAMGGVVGALVSKGLIGIFNRAGVGIILNVFIKSLMNVINLDLPGMTFLKSISNPRQVYSKD